MLTFDDFRELAKQDVSTVTKIGFEEHLRNKEIDAEIVQHIILRMLEARGNDINYFNNKHILDIGCGCSFLTKHLIDVTRDFNSTLTLLDSKEMLDNLSDENHIQKIDCQFPFCPDFLEKYHKKFDFIIINSVVSLTYDKNNEKIFYNFLDKALDLMNDHGVLFIGDLPNSSKQNRTLKDMGLQKANEDKRTDCEIDDNVVFDILKRYRDKGFHTTLNMPCLFYPMRYIRDDILIFRTGNTMSVKK